MRKVELDNIREIQGVKEVIEGCFELIVNESFPTLVVISAIHGNEPVGVSIIHKKILESIQSKINVNYKFVVGNLKAYEQDKRFVQTDLNRSFCVQNPSSYEEMRATDILEFIYGGDVLVDFHQTQEPSESAFFIFNYSDENYYFTSCVNPGLPTVTFKNSFSSENGKGVSSAFNTFEKPSCTIELGMRGVEKSQIDLGLEIIRNTENYLLNKSSPKDVNLYTFHSTIFNKENELKLIPGLINFSKISKGENLYSNIVSGEKKTSNLDGVILFPKYGENAKYSNELVRILKKCTKEDL